MRGVILGLLLTLGMGAPLQAMTCTTETVNGKTCDVITWSDASGKPRSVALVRADGDVHGFNGGYIERYTYPVGDKQVTGMAWNAGQEGVSGLGCVVNHYGKTSAASKSGSKDASTSFVLKGDNHCIWRFQSTYFAGAELKLRLDYLISEGVNDVTWAVSFDTSGVADKAVQADARGPYCQFDWDNDGHFYDGRISGIRWGDRYHFRTVSYAAGQPAACTWDYSQANTIPYMCLYKDEKTGDIEAGAVQTQSWAQQDAGGYWWSKNWGKTGTGMPENWNCPFQLCAYENYASEKMAWGTNYGYVGNSQYDELGNVKKRSGWPHQGYTVLMVFNQYAQHHLDALVGSMEAAQATTCTASVGTVVANGPRHLGLAGDAPYQPAGWNHVYGAWTIAAKANAITVTLKTEGGKALVRPMFCVTDYTAAAPPKTVTLNNATLNAGTDYAASLDTMTHQLWLTLKRDLSGAGNTLHF